MSFHVTRVIKARCLFINGATRTRTVPGTGHDRDVNRAPWEGSEQGMDAFPKEDSQTETGDSGMAQA